MSEYSEQKGLFALRPADTGGAAYRLNDSGELRITFRSHEKIIDDSFDMAKKFLDNRHIQYDMEENSSQLQKTFVLSSEEKYRFVELLGEYEQGKKQASLGILSSKHIAQQILAVIDPFHINNLKFQVD